MNSNHESPKNVGYILTNKFTFSVLFTWLIIGLTRYNTLYFHFIFFSNHVRGATEGQSQCKTVPGYNSLPYCSYVHVFLIFPEIFEDLGSFEYLASYNVLTRNYMTDISQLLIAHSMFFIKIDNILKICFAGFLAFVTAFLQTEHQFRVKIHENVKNRCSTCIQQF